MVDIRISLRRSVYMSAPISLLARTVLFACAAILPLAAFSAAYAYDEARRKKLNIISFIIGLLTIAVVGVVLYQYR